MLKYSLAFSLPFLRLMVVGALGVGGTAAMANEEMVVVEEAPQTHDADFVMTRKKQPLERALSQVERHFGVSINYPLPLIKGYQVRTAFRARTAADAVGVLLMGLPFVYEVKGEYITIAPREVRRSRGAIVLGRVVDEDRQPLSNVRVEIFGLGADERRQSGVLTNEAGEFQIHTTGLEESVLKVGALGRETQSIVLRHPEFEVQVGTIILRMADVALGEVVVTPKELVARADREIIYPQKTVETAVDGVDLIEQLRSPGSRLLPTDVALTEETFAALNVRINGRRAQLFEVRALRFEDIIRVEYLYQPGPSGAEPYAINLVTRPRPGVAAGVDVRALCFGDLNLGAFGRIEGQHQTLSLQYEGEQARWRQYAWDEQSPLRTVQTQSSEAYRHERHQLALHADFRPHERHHFRITLSDDWQRKAMPRLVRMGTTSSDTLTQRESSHSPRLAVSYEGTAERNRRWETSVRAQHHHETNHRHFRIEDAASAAFDRRIRGFEVEVRAAYHYKWKRWESSFETQLENEDWRENRQTRYAYHAWKTKLGLQFASRRWTTHAALGAEHVAWDGNAHLLLHPAFGLRFKPSETLALWSQWQERAVAPTLAQRSALPLPLDPYRQSLGQVNLRPQRDWTAALGAEVRKKPWSASAGVEYTTARAPIGQYLETAGRYRWQNGRSSSDVSPFLAFDLSLWQQFLRWRSRYAFHHLTADAFSTHYHHLESEVSGRAGRWQYGLSLTTERRSLQGEREQRTALSQQTYLRYARASWTLGATFRPTQSREEILWRNSLDGGRKLRILPDVQPQILLTFQWRLAVAPE